MCTVGRINKLSLTLNAAFVGHRYVKRLLRTLKDSSNNYIWRDGRSGSSGNGEIIKLPDTIYGYPFYEQNDLAQSELYFGDWTFYIIGDRQTMSVQTTNVGGDAWRINQIEKPHKILAPVRYLMLLTAIDRSVKICSWQHKNPENG